MTRLAGELAGERPGRRGLRPRGKGRSQLRAWRAVERFAARVSRLEGSMEGAAERSLSSLPVLLRHRGWLEGQVSERDRVLLCDQTWDSAVASLARAIRASRTDDLPSTADDSIVAEPSVPKEISWAP